MTNTFKKSEKLCSHTLIQQLFNEGKAITIYPLKLIYLQHPPVESTPACVQVLFTISKRNFKKAVERNLLKRRLREAYRINKTPLNTITKTLQRSTYIAIIYTSKKEENYQLIEQSIQKGLDLLIKKITPS